MLPSGAAERRPCCTGALEGIEAFADAGANQLVLVMARLKSGSVLPGQHTPVLSFANLFGFRWPNPTSTSPSGGGGPACEEAKGAD
jgi:hypothetical protein